MAPASRPLTMAAASALLIIMLLHPQAARAQQQQQQQQQPSSSSSSSSSTALPAFCAAAPYSVPKIAGRDQAPTPPALLGRCTDRVEAHTRLTSSWCHTPPYTEYIAPLSASAATATTAAAAGGAPAAAAPAPAARPLAAEACAKRGRMTVYRGPVLGYESSHVGACNATLAGSSTHALVAVSTAHLSSRQGAWEPEPGACGSCVCVRVAGADAGMNPSVGPMYAANVAGATGASFMAVVGDRCGECEDDHLDVLLDRPLAFAPYDRESPDGQDQARALAAALRPGQPVPPVRPTNRRAPLVNRLRGPRVFSAAASLRGVGRGAPEAVGVYVADWQWSPCEWSHSQCAAMWRRLGYNGPKGAWTPPVRAGVDSDTGAEIKGPEQDGSFCCGAAEPGVEAPEVSDALPPAVRASIAARLAAAGGAEAAEAAAAAAVAAEEAKAAAAAASAGGGAAASSSGAATSNATNQPGEGGQDQPSEEPMYNAAEEFAATFGSAAQPSLLATRGSRAGGGGAAAGASLLSSSTSAAARAGAAGGARRAGTAAAAPTTTGTGGVSTQGKIAGIVVGATVGAGVAGVGVWMVMARRQAATAAAAAATVAALKADIGKTEHAAGKSKSKKDTAPAFVMPPPPASGNGAEMGGVTGGGGGGGGRG